MLKQLNCLDVGTFEEHLRINEPSDVEILSILDATLSRPESLIIHKNKQREKRNEFLKRLISLLSDRSESVKNFIINKANVINVSEELFDSISKFINDCEISKCEPDVQIWSHINRVESQFAQIRADIDKNLQKKPKRKMLTPFVELKSEEGGNYSPDVALENQIKYLTLTLSLLAYKFKWFQDGKIILPNKVTVGENDIFKAGSIELLARSWKGLEECSIRSILFGGDVFRNQGDEVQEDAKACGVKTSYHFQRSETDFEMFDSISCERVKKRSLQNFFEIISNPEKKSIIAPDFKSVGKLSEGSFLNENEILTFGNLEDVFCTDIYSDDTEYNGITLRDWIRGYFTLRYLSEEVRLGKLLSTMSKLDLLNYLTSSGLLEESANTFIDLVTFGENSKDLYDCPLIKMGGDSFYLSYFSLVHANISNLILSIFSSLEIESSEKGYKFEKEAANTITKYLSECKGFKFKRGLEEYEYDAVFILDKRIFILECKNRSLSWFSPVKSYRNKKYLSKTVKQINRLKNALIEYPEVLLEHFSVDVNQFEIVPVIFNCMPFSWKGKFEGVYINDFSSLCRFAKSSSINWVMTSAKGQTKKSSNKSKQWSGNKPSSSDLLRHLESPIQLKPYLSARKENQYWLKANNEIAFTVMDFEVDTHKYAKEEKKLFSSPPPPVKKKLIKPKSKKKMVKKSRKKNRR
ncbi:hypothetical protein [Shewanella algae]|uniref:hypothetical protein n=1 Tax=Shewanella algae TaxID=38313 RepID=UPI001AAE0DD6|nr:hypothetical protein [Shewanella algae]MBO2701488.1 hypothetical protein [Shewanella algae]